MMKEQVKKIVALVLLCMIVPQLCAQSDSKAIELLKKVEQNYAQSSGVEAKYHFVGSDQSGAELANFEGTIQMRGASFRLTTPDMGVWYNGVEQWTLFADAGEVNLSQPDPSELQAINPFMLYSLYKSGYHCTLSTAGAVVMNPESDEPIKSITLIIDKQRLTPKEIVVENSDQSQYTIKVVAYESGLDLQPQTFSYDAARYPDVEVIDLR